MRQQNRTLDMVRGLALELGDGPWALSDVLAQGWTRAQVRRALEAGRLCRPHRGVIGLPSELASSDRVEQSLHAIRAAVLVAGEGAVLSHGSAALLHDLWAPESVDLVHLTLPGAPDRVDHGMRIHGSRLPQEFVIMHQGLLVTTVPRTAVDLARGRRLPEALMAVDGAARRLAMEAHGLRESDLRDARRREMCLPSALTPLQAAYESVRTWRGSVVVRDALRLVELGSESPLESRSRGWMCMVGLPSPQVAYEVRGRSGRRYFADFCWPERRVIGEADGSGKYGETGVGVTLALRRERERQRDLEDAGWTIIRWDSREAWGVVVARLRRGLT